MPFASASLKSRRPMLYAACGIFAVTLLASCAFAQQHNYPSPVDGTYVAKDFRFTDGESLPNLKLHYLTIGTLKRDAQGHATNAVMIMHGTGGTGRQFLSPVFADVLYGPGQPLDATKYFIILPNAIGAVDQASRATACTRTFRSTPIRIWCTGSTRCS
jgi:homoserine O-acetyltransferase